MMEGNTCDGVQFEASRDLNRVKMRREAESKEYLILSCERLQEKKRKSISCFGLINELPMTEISTDFLWDRKCGVTITGWSGNLRRDQDWYHLVHTPSTAA